MSCRECGAPGGAGPQEWLRTIHDVLAKTYAPVLMKDVEELAQLRADFADIQESLRATTAQLDHSKRAEAEYRARLESMSPEGLERVIREASGAKAELGQERQKTKALEAAAAKSKANADELVGRLNQIIKDLEADNTRLRKQLVGAP